MSTVAVFSAVALAVAAPDLVTIAGMFVGRGGRRRAGMSAWPLVSVVTVVHVGLVVATVLAGRGMS